MYSLKGFFTFSPLIDNTQDQVAGFGELSSDALTYAKDKTYHTNEVTPQTTLVSFESQLDGTYAAPPAALLVTTLQVGQFLLDRSMDGTLAADPDVMRTNLQAEFPTQIQNLTTGEVREVDGIRLPEWVRFEVSGGNEPNDVLIWLSDESFRQQYSGYHIEVIPPIWPLDDFFKDPLVVQALLADYDIVEKMDEVQTVRGEYPYTQLMARKYDYVDPVNPDNTAHHFSTTWMVMVYGQAGNNPDLIKNALIDYVLDNSAHTRDEWANVIPDLFLTTEFIITPFWTHYAIPNRELQAGIYSPTIKPGQWTAVLEQTVKGPKYTPEWIAAEYEISNLIFKSLAFGVVGNPQNSDGVTSFYEKFSDYIIVTNTSADFNRMSDTTQEFVTLLGEMIEVAEDLNDAYDLPVNMSRVTRDGVDYVAALFDNVTYLIVSKEQLESMGL